VARADQHRARAVAHAQPPAGERGEPCVRRAVAVDDVDGIRAECPDERRDPTRLLLRDRQRDRGNAIARRFGEDARLRCGVDHDPVDITQTQTVQTAVNQSGKVTFPVNSYVRIGTPSGDYPLKPLQFDYSIEVYVKPQNGSGERRLLGKVEKGAVLYEAWVSNGNVQAKVADQGALNASQELQSVSNRLTLANHTLPQGARAMLYYRPSGSTEAFRTLGKDPNSEPGSYTIDVGTLPDGDYEMIFMAISDGTDESSPTNAHDVRR